MKSNDKIRTYYDKHFGSIEGYFNIVDAKLFQYFNEIQREIGIEGDIFEIGVHHGKSAILLAHLVEPGRETLHVNDLFEEQEANISRSGSGSYEIFMDNIRQCFQEIGFLRVHKGPSQSLDPELLAGDVRIFHIDGGHSAPETFQDLRFAYEAAGPDGVIIVDDYFNRDWPGVSEGFNSFVREHRDIVPIIIGINKVFIIKEKALKVYQDYLSYPKMESFLSHEGLWYNYKTWMGKDVIVIQCESMFRCNIRTMEQKYVINKSQESSIETMITNMSTISIQSSQNLPIYVSYHLLDRDLKVLSFDNTRTALPSAVHPGEEVAVKLVVDKISNPGRYYLEIDCVYEHVTWFKESGSQSCLVELEVV